MYLKKEYRGFGFGNLMMEKLIKKSKKLNYKKIKLSTTSCLKQAVSLYKKFGFKEFEWENLNEKDPDCDIAFEKEWHLQELLPVLLLKKLLLMIFCPVYFLVPAPVVVVVV